MTEKQPLLQCTDICLSFRGNNILEHISLSVNAGEVVTLIGPNGSGKTTLSRVLLGLQAPDSGSVARAKKLVVGYMPQKLSIDPVLPLTVRRFLRIRPTVTSLRDKHKVEDVAKMLGIEHLLTKQMHVISGGELQRVLLARAVLRKPNLMVLDEPVQGLDMAGQAEFYHILEQIKKELNCGVLMISHDLHMVMASTSRVVCINKHICCQGYPEEISKHPEYLALFGKKEAASMAVYTHDHDHTHDASGAVRHDCGGQHD